MNKLLWLDLETTGLDEKTDVPLEVGMIVTDYNLNILNEISFIIKHPAYKLNIMNPFVRKMHTENGLLMSCTLQGDTIDLVEAKMIEFVQDNMPKGKKPILTGGGIHFDRRFLKVHFKIFEELLHYRMLDVSTFDLLFTGMGYENLAPKKKKLHRSLDDIRESIDELKTYVNAMKIGLDKVTADGR